VFFEKNKLIKIKKFSLEQSNPKLLFFSSSLNAELFSLNSNLLKLRFKQTDFFFQRFGLLFKFKKIEKIKISGTKLS
jgi:hypothetical protein